MINRENNSFSISDRIKSFLYAFQGLKLLWKTEHNARIHLVIFILVIIAGVYFSISTWDWMMVLIVSILVFITELFNSAIEYLADKVTSSYDELIGKSKDLSAAAVLLAALLAVICGVFIFLPHLVSLFQ